MNVRTHTHTHTNDTASRKNFCPKKLCVFAIGKYTLSQLQFTQWMQLGKLWLRHTLTHMLRKGNSICPRSLQLNSKSKGDGLLYFCVCFQIVRVVGEINNSHAHYFAESERALCVRGKCWEWSNENYSSFDFSFILSHSPFLLFVCYESIVGISQGGA